MSFAILVHVALLLLFTTVCADMDDIITWVRSKEGGFFSNKLEIRRIDPTDSTSPFGVFAKEDVSAKDELMQIPHECYIEVWDEAKEKGITLDDYGYGYGYDYRYGHDSDSDYDYGYDYDDDDDYNYYENICLLSHKLMDEMKLGDDSSFAPYIAYLQTQRPGQLPAMWSKAGKNMLRKVLEPGDDGVDWMDWYYYMESSCISDDPFQMHALEMTIQRSFDNALIPIWDMVNHDNGRINTENDSVYGEGGVKVRAARDIKAGEEIFMSYDACVDCGDTYNYWGTPEILRDFGFVEGYPHRWVDHEKGIWFEIWEDPDGARWAYWDDDEMYGYLQGELKRLREVGASELNNEGGNVPKHEWNTIVKFHEAAIDDIETVIYYMETAQYESKYEL